MPKRGAKSRRRFSDTPSAVCFGEVLWDCLPRGLFLGGAPMNVGYHLARQGVQVAALTAVGRDFLGDEALRRIAAWGLDTRFVARTKRPTGTVQAIIDEQGSARYEIARNAAWDQIAVGPRLWCELAPPRVLVFGTLALRGRSNRESLEAVFSRWPETVRIVDLNFRPPFDTASVVRFALKSAHVVKLNEHELAQLLQNRRADGTPSALEKGARKLSARSDVTRICVTAGSRGAGLLWDGEWYWENAKPVTVRDTVGAGDAFLGGLLGALFVRKAAPREALRQACRWGEFVAAADGATPEYSVRDIVS